MKKLFLNLILILLFSAPAICQEGTNFEHLTLEAALTKAKAANKLVFIDCYTSWCGPCKKLSAEIFPQKNVGDYMNERFISVKYDVEKEENKYIAKQFEIRVYPTMLIVSADGVLIDRIIGFQSADKLIESMENSFDKNKSLSGLKEKYKNGDEDKRTLTDYFAKLQADGSAESVEVGEKLYSTLSDKEKQSDTFWFFFSNEKFTNYSSERFNYLIKNYKEFCTNIGKQKVDKVLTREWEKTLKKGISLNATLSLSELKSVKKQYSEFGYKQDYNLNSIYTLAEVCISKNVTDIVKTSNKEIGFIGKNIQYWAPICDIVSKNGSKDNNLEWIKICEKIRDTTTDSYYKNILSVTIDLLKKRL